QTRSHRTACVGRSRCGPRRRHRRRGGVRRELDAPRFCEPSPIERDLPLMTESESMRLPDDFLVGASTAAHQIEGDNTTSDWWAFEQARPETVQASGRACDSFRRWGEDMDLLAS